MVKIPSEIERLYNLGFAIHWLRPKSKIPVDSGWTSGPRADIDQLRARFKSAYNYGVRLGEASKVAGAYLGVLDVDVKSADPKHAKEAHAKLFELYPEVKGGPYLKSGRGNGSAHFYVRLPQWVKGDDVKARSGELVKVKMPSVPPSKREAEELTDAEIAEGLRLRPAWEISLLCQGRQAAVVGSIHPDTGEKYVWGKAVNGTGKDIPLLKAENGQSETSLPVRDRTADRGPPRAPEFKFETVDPKALPLTPEQVSAVVTGDGVVDRSAKVYELCIVLASAGVSDGKIISLFTDRNNYLGHCAFDHRKTKDRQLAARWVEKYCLRKAKTRAESVFDVEEMPSDAELQAKKDAQNKRRPKAEPATRVWPKGFSGSAEWESQIELAWKSNKPVVKITLANMILILENSAPPGFIRFNEFTKKTHWFFDTPWGIPAGAERSGANEDEVKIKVWFAEKFKIEPNNTVLTEALQTIADRNRFHPVKDYLESLEWDGVKRVDKAFRTYFGCKMADPYLRKITRKFFLACVKRIYQPGCKFDHVVTLEGRQGAGKSSFGRILASPEWFINGLPNLHDKDAALNLVGMWICELGELAAVNRSELSSVKEFITREFDNVRPPYGHRRVTYKRTIVFIGTTDKREYLTDPEGNRRFWPVSVGQCDFVSLEWDRDQLWAEAKWLYDNKREPIFLKQGSKAELQARAYQESRRIEDESDTVKLLLVDWDAEQRPNKKGFVEITITDIFRSVLSSVLISKNARSVSAVSKVLSGLGYAKKHTKRGNVWRRKQGSPFLGRVHQKGEPGEP